MKQARTLSDRELRLVLRIMASRAHAARNRALVMTSFLAGLRVGEIAALSISDAFDADMHARSEFVLAARKAKGGRARRVFVSATLRSEWNTYLRALRAPQPDDPLFTSQKRNRFSANALCQVFTRLFLDARLDGASSHSGRRTFITQLASKGVGVRALAELAGHANITTTQRYIDVNDDQLRAAVELL